jgi:hypothetical protein
MPSVRYRTKGFEIRLRCEQRQDLVATRKQNRGAGVKKWRGIAAPWKTRLAGYASTCLLVTCGKSISPS